MPATKKFLLPCVLVSLLFALFAVPAIAIAQEGGQGLGHINKKGVDVDLRSLGKQVSDEVQQVGTLIVADSSPVPSESVVPQIKTRGGNVQVNDPSLDNIQIFPNFRPFVKFTQSETSVAKFGSNNRRDVQHVRESTPRSDQSHHSGVYSSVPVRLLDVQ